jgi:TRAP-type C4-dicarboxylate transport system substrate-binding protein
MKLLKGLIWGLIVFMFLISVPSISAADKPIVLRVAHFMGDTPLIGAERFLGDEVAKRTNGRVKIETYYGQTLGKAKELLGLVKSGSVDIACVAAGYFPSQFPLWSGPNGLPFVMKSVDTPIQVSLKIPNEIPAVQEEMKKQNVKFLFAEPLAGYTMFAKKPVVKFEDLKGLKVRTYGMYLPQAMEAAGAVGVTIHPMETYESLKRGVIDASIWPLQAGYFMKNHEVAPHACLWDIQTIVGYSHLINLDVWNKLPADIQKIILEVEKENYQDARARYLRHRKEAEGKLKAEGATIHSIDPNERQKWIDASPNFFDQWVKSCEKKGKGAGAKQMRAMWIDIVKKYDK